MGCKADKFTQRVPRAGDWDAGPGARGVGNIDGLQHRPRACHQVLQLVKIAAEVSEHKLYRFVKQEIDVCLISEV